MASLFFFFFPDCHSLLTFLGKYFCLIRATSGSAIVFNTSGTIHYVWCALSDRCLETSQDAWHTLLCLAFINPLLSPLFSSPFPLCFSPLFSEKQMLTEWKQIVRSPFEHSTLILGLLATCLHVWLSVEGLSCAAKESQTRFYSVLSLLPARRLRGQEDSCCAFHLSLALHPFQLASCISLTAPVFSWFWRRVWA